MIGRGAIGRPTVFHEIIEGMGWAVGTPPWGEGSPSKARRWCWDRYLELSEEVFDESGGKNLKRHAVSFTKGLPGASAMRVRLHSIQDKEQLGDEVSRYLHNLEEDRTQSEIASSNL